MMDIKSKSNTSTNKRVTYSYVRVSTTDQEEGNSISVQKKLAEEFSNTHNLGEITYFEETKSASKVKDTDFDIASDLYKSLSNRPGLQKIIKYAQQKRFTDLIVYSRDRLARNLEMQIALNFFFSKNNIKVHFSKPGESLLTNDNRLSNFFNIVLGSVAELEANLIASRVKAGQEQCVKMGVWAGGRLPFGYGFKRYGTKNHTLHPLPTEQKVVEEIFKMYTHDGYSYRKIADALNKDCDGLIPIWTKGKIESIIKNEVYRGCIVWNRRSRENKLKLEDDNIKSTKYPHLEYIDETQWKKALNLRLKKAKVKDPKFYNTPFLLRDKLVCADCGKLMKSKNYGKDKYGNERSSIYRCDVPKGNKPHLIINKDLIEKVFLTSFIAIDSPSNIEGYWTVYQQQIDVKQKNNLNMLTDIPIEIRMKEDKVAKIDEALKVINIELNSLDIEVNEKKAEIRKLKNPSKDVKERLSKELEDLEIHLSIETTIRDDLLSERTNLINEINSATKSLDILNEQNDDNFFQNPEELEAALRKFIQHDYFQLDDIRKRMIIDMLVDRITVRKDSNSEAGFKMEILFKKP